MTSLKETLLAFSLGVLLAIPAGLAVIVANISHHHATDCQSEAAQ